MILPSVIATGEPGETAGAAGTSENGAVGESRVGEAFATSTVVNAVFEYVLKEVHEGHLLPGELISDTALAARLGVSRTPVREAILRLREIGVVEISASRFTRVAVVSPQQTADAMIVWVALFSALVQEVIPRVSDEVLAEMQADHVNFLELAGWTVEPGKFAELQQNPALAETVGEQGLSGQKIALAGGRFFARLLVLSINPVLIRNINSVVHLIQLGSQYLPDYMDFRQISECQKQLIIAAQDRDRQTAERAIRLLQLIVVPTRTTTASVTAS